MQFKDRRQAGRQLGQALLEYVGASTLVLGLPRGGVPVAFEVARILEAPLDIWMVRKLGVPRQPELGMGAIAEGPAVHLDRDLVASAGLSAAQVMAVVHLEAAEIRRREALYRAGHPAPDVRGRTVILVDDGIATGGTIRAAIEGVRKRGARRVILAAPVASPEVVAVVRPLVDGLVCPFQPRDLFAIGAWYEDFRQVPDAEVRRLLGLAREAAGGVRWAQAAPAL
jgi:putative phosphoribosyl transferase